MHTNVVSIFPANRDSYRNDGIFDPRKQDEWSPIIVYVKKFLKKQKIEIHTTDIATRKPPYRHVYFDLPYPWYLQNFSLWRKIILNKKKNILICHEPPIINPFDYMKIFHSLFTKIYTWNDDRVDNKKYFKITLPQHSFGMKTRVKKFTEKKFLVLINSNKSPFFPFRLLSQFGRELYSDRMKAVEFFERRIPKDFYLYGRGWNTRKKYSLTEVFFGYKKYRTYKGSPEINDKIELMSHFKYCVCFENLTDVNGYVTEKIFDCFKAKCVPIYWGASNITSYIPRGCFIDFREFGDYEKLLTFLTSIDETRYNHYIENIEKLMRDRNFQNRWFENGFAKFFLKDILDI